MTLYISHILSEEIPAPPPPQKKKKSSGVDCVVAWATWRSLHGVGFHHIEDHGVTLLTIVSWRGDLVSIKYISYSQQKRNETKKIINK
jgi:hypothetical protein